ncbi:MAG: hypothetical protein GXP63_06600 [DPANN group archaeon]|nr:hypothetical protein [DPANN group archaeon]
MNAASTQLRFDRNILLFGEEGQRRLMDTHVLLHGTNTLSQKIALSLISLGIGRLSLIGPEHLQGYDPSDFLLYLNPSRPAEGMKADGLRSTLEQIALRGKQQVDSYGIPPDPGFLSFLSPDIIIDATNALESKDALSAYAMSHGTHLISASATSTDGLAQLCSSGQSPVDRASLERLIGKDYGIFTGSITAGLVSNLVRRIAIPFANEQKTLPPVLTQSYALSRIAGITTPIDAPDALPWPSSRPYAGVKALVIGTGGIGNFLALDLALLGITHVTLVDPDVIEESNLNRQPLLYGRVGKPKATVIGERMGLIYPGVSARPLVDFFSYKHDDRGRFQVLPEPLASEHYDLIFSCVDNETSRLAINDYAVQTRTVLVQGRLGTGSGLHTYVPGRNRCIDCQENLRASLENQKATGLDVDKVLGPGCQLESNPNIVVPNIIVAGLMTEEGLRALYRPASFARQKDALFYEGVGSFPFSFRGGVDPYYQAHPCIDVS